MKKRIRQIAMILYVIIIISILSAIAQAEYPPPSEDEKALFTEIFNRINNYGANNIPYGVGNIALSIDPNNIGGGGSYKTSFKCPEGSSVSSVNINVITKLVNWIPKGECIGANACYWWDLENNPIIKDNIKNQTFTNYIMIDQKNMSKTDVNIGMIFNEGVLYHELLHGQLQIDSPIWRSRLCNCQNVDVQDEDMHKKIYKYEEDYTDGSFRKAGYVVIHKAIKISDKSPWEYDLSKDLTSAGKNSGMVAGQSALNVVINEKPTIQDKNLLKVNFALKPGVKEGFFTIYIDPTNYLIILDVTVELYKPSYINGTVAGYSFDAFGYIILVICLMTVSIWYLRRKT